MSNGPDREYIDRELKHLRELIEQRIKASETALDLQAAEYERRMEILNNDRAEARRKEADLVSKQQYDIYIRDAEKRAEELANSTQKLAKEVGERINGVVKELGDRLSICEGRLAAGFAWGAGMGFTLVILTFAINYFGKK
jgi:hypothetical protein